MQMNQKAGSALKMAGWRLFITAVFLMAVQKTIKTVIQIMEGTQTGFVTMDLEMV